MGAAVMFGIGDDRTVDSAPSRRTCKRRCDVVGIRALSPISTRTLDASKYGLELEVDGGSGGCWGVCKISTRPRCGRMRSQPGITLSLAAAAKVKV